MWNKECLFEFGKVEIVIVVCIVYWVYGNWLGIRSGFC